MSSTCSSPHSTLVVLGVLSAESKRLAEDTHTRFMTPNYLFRYDDNDFQSNLNEETIITRQARLFDQEIGRAHV